MKNPLTRPEMELLRKVAVGQEKADLVLLHGQIVDVYGGIILDDYSIAVKGSWIAIVDKNIDQTIGPGTHVVDTSGKIIVPGFVDGHTHLNYICNPEGVLSYCIAGGTTTMINESLEICHTAGFKGVLEYIEAFRNQPIKVFTTVPIPLNLNKSGDKIVPTIDQLKKLLTLDDIVGVGESYWQMVLNGNRCLPELAEESLRLGKTVEGHTAGAHGEKLTAYLSYGINSDHESTTIEDLLERLRMGLFTMIREGSVRKELEAMAPLAQMKIDFSRLALVTDGLDPREIKNGYLEVAVQRAINMGFDFIKTIQMVTINPATHFRLDHYLGGLAPAKHADMLILKNQTNIKPELVFSKGILVAQDGNLIVKPRESKFTVKGLTALKKHVKSSDLLISAPAGRAVKIRLMNLETDLLSREILVDMISTNGELQTDISRDITKVTLLTPGNRIFNAFIRGFGFKSGAIASSYIWETYGIIAIGTNDIDITCAINRVIDHGGGIVVCDKTKLVAELALPIAGTFTKIPMDEIIDRLNSIQNESEKLGSKLSDVIKTASVLTTGAIPFLRITEDGLLDIKTNKTLSLFVD